MKKVVLYLIIFFMSICIYSENSFYKRGDLNIVLEASIQNKAIHVYLILKNNKSENCYIPYDYLNFYCEDNNEQTMKNDCSSPREPLFETAPTLRHTRVTSTTIAVNTNKRFFCILSLLCFSLSLTTGENLFIFKQFFQISRFKKEKTVDIFFVV